MNARNAIPRRTVLGVFAASTAGAVVPLLGDVPSAQAETKPKEAAHMSEEAHMSEDLLFISTWQGTEIYGARFDAQHGTMTLTGTAGAAVSNWATMHPTRPVLYVGSGLDGGFVYSFDIDLAAGTLKQSGTVRTDAGGTSGGGLGYLFVDPPSDTLLVANFEAGLAATLPIGAEGTLLGDVASTVQDTGSGPNARQTGPHPHFVTVDPSGRYALVADFGADRIFVYRYDRDSRALTASSVDGTGYYATDPGSGPRRILFHTDGRTAFTLNELTATIEILDWNAEKGSLTRRRILAMDPPTFTGTKSGAELALSDDGRFLYASNRGENQLIVYRVDAQSEEPLEEVQRIPCAGLTPWSFTIHRSGRWLFVANEVSSTVNLFSIEQGSGMLTDTGRSMSVPNPDCITFCYCQSPG